MTTLGLIRHGATEWNLLGRIQGQTDIPLHPDGVQQVQLLADRLASQYGHWDMIWSSDLIRAKQTAEILAERLNLSPIHIDSRLRERGFGLAEGTTEEQRIEKFGTEWRDVDIGMEDDDAIRLRGSSFLQDITDIYEGKRILVISHGGFLKRFLTMMLQDAPDIVWSNASLTIASRNQGKWRLERSNNF